MNHSTDQQAGGVGHDMTLAPFDLLGGIVTLRSTALGGLDRLAVNDPGRRAGFAPSDLPGFEQKLKINPLEEAGISPFIEIPLHCREGRKVFWQHPPLAAAPRDIQDRVQHRRGSVPRGRPNSLRTGIKCSINAYSASLRLLASRCTARSYFRRVISVHMLPLLAGSTITCRSTR